MVRFLLPAAALVAMSFAQTFTDCNPLNETCPDEPALGTTFTEVYNSSLKEFDTRFWTVEAGTDLISFDEESAVLPLRKSSDTVTLKSKFYIFWGTVEMIFKAAPGTGIVSTVILLSNNLDEIDWEVLGGNSTTVSNNYYGWGNLTQINGEYPALEGAQSEYHNYTIDWTQERIQFSLNGNVVREVGYQEPGLYPQSPSRVQFGLWCGGCSANEGTVAWAGGKPDFDQAPFEMHIKSLRVVDGTPNATYYSFNDRSGHYSSVDIAKGESEASKRINEVSNMQSAREKWDGLSTGAKIGIACAVFGVLGIALIAFAFYCVSQRKKGKAEALLHEKEWEAQNAELMEYKTMMAKGNFAVSRDSIMTDAGLRAQKPRGSFYSRVSGRF